MVFFSKGYMGLMPRYLLDMFCETTRFLRLEAFDFPSISPIRLVKILNMQMLRMHVGKVKK